MVQSINVDKGLLQVIKELSGQVIAAFPVFQLYPRPSVLVFHILVFGLLRNRGSGPQNALRDKGLVVLSFLVVTDGLPFLILFLPLLGVFPLFWMEVELLAFLAGGVMVENFLNFGAKLSQKAKVLTQVAKVK